VTNQLSGKSFIKQKEPINQGFFKGFLINF